MHDQCVPAFVRTSDPAPCAALDLTAGEDRGYAIVKDLQGARQFLLIPTARIAGIESPALLDPATPNYFGIAWRARSFTEAVAGGTLPRHWLSLAVNSAVSRSQDQLHIHIDCLRADVHDAVVRYADQVGPTWVFFPVPLAGQTFSAMTVAGEDLDGHNPFLLLAEGLPGAFDEMGRHTLAVVGVDRADGAPGFLILAATAERPETAVGAEDLQDHTSCPAPLPAGPSTAK